jgi:CubicO group peptidase (beta-lactamase class C family)
MDFMQQKADALTQSGVFSGIEWRVDQHAETLFAGRSGVQDVQTESGIPDQAIYRIYSMTKPIVSVLALILIEQGVFRLNTPLSELDPRFSKMRILGTDGHLAPADGCITIEHLLTHRAGFSYDFTVGCPVAPVLSRGRDHGRWRAGSVRPCRRHCGTASGFQSWAILAL